MWDRLGFKRVIYESDDVPYSINQREDEGAHAAYKSSIIESALPSFPSARDLCVHVCQTSPMLAPYDASNSPILITIRLYFVFLV